jgi:hypothetical protein
MIKATKGSLDEEIIVYKAINIGTDDDYLKKSSTRAIFRDNAILQSDARLFTMEIDKSENNDYYFGLLSPAEYPNRFCHSKNVYIGLAISLVLMIVFWIVAINKISLEK